MIIDIFRYLSRSSVHSRIIIDIRNIFLVHHLFKLFPFREQIRWIRKRFHCAAAAPGAEAAPQRLLSHTLTPVTVHKNAFPEVHHIQQTM